jgi:hypothetical protein
MQGQQEKLRLQWRQRQAMQQAMRGSPRQENTSREGERVDGLLSSSGPSKWKSFFVFAIQQTHASSNTSNGHQHECCSRVCCMRLRMGDVPSRRTTQGKCVAAAAAAARRKCKGSQHRARARRVEAQHSEAVEEED